MNKHLGRSALVATLALLVASAGTADATTSSSELQPSWEELEPARQLPVMHSPAVAYDTDRNRIVVLTLKYGTERSALDAWTGSDWRRISRVRPNPTFRMGSGFVYDRARSEFVLFGGHTLGDETPRETWTFDGSSWTKHNPAVSPPGSVFVPMAYDPVRAETVAFVGASTWVWDGTSWADRTPATSPPVGSARTMAWHPSRGAIILYDGVERATWAWDGATWTPLDIRRGPTVINGTMATSEKGVLQFGGRTGGSDLLNDQAWVLGSNRWHRVQDAGGPAGRIGAIVIEDRAGDQVLVHGGIGKSEEGWDTQLEDTWVLRRG